MRTNRNLSSSALPVLIGLFIGLTSVPSLAQEQRIQFNRDIRPILSDKCFACHGPDAEHAAADLRLDVRQNAIDSGVLVPGHADDSEMVVRIFSDDSDVMPPLESHKPLSSDERTLLRRWIEEGAKYESHWAYTPMQFQRVDTGKNLVDHHVQAKLAQRKLEAVHRADRNTLIRRLAIDLTGIPPTIEEVDAFIQDDSETAYSKLVERLLSSPRFGERMASYWLDLVRYADTVGYHGDQNISQWPYRDYVIDAFNNNTAYDQFVREQLAGDLLPDATIEQKTASGYNRLNQTTEEGGSQAKEYLAIYFADRVRNASQVFLGSTLGCAQCHDHKYDPFTAKDFYSFGAFFADLNERGVYGGRGSRPPVLRLPSNAQKQEMTQLRGAIATATDQRAKLRETVLNDMDDWAPAISPVVLLIEDEQPVAKDLVGDWKFTNGKDAPVHGGNSSRVQQASGLVQHYFNRLEQKIELASNATFHAWVYLDPNDPPSAIMLQFNDGKSWEHRSVWGGDEITYGRRPKSWSGYQRMGPLPQTGQWVKLEVNTAALGLEGEGQESQGKSNTRAIVTGIAFTQFGGRTWWGEVGYSQSPPTNVLEAFAIAKTDRTEKQSKVLSDYYLSTSTALNQHDRMLSALRVSLKRVEDSVATTVISEAVAPREIRILPRGNWMDDSGDVVQPAIPEFLGSLETGGRRATRLDLANWITQPDNPLTARTMVNRMWSLMFGRGICTSVDDFGGQGTYPSNPELLDALAVEFVESGWDVKHLLRVIVMSETYQRSSLPTAQLLADDPFNDLFGRQGRFRVDAEVIRDSALFVSGQLVERTGGPSAKPYQPIGYYAQLNFPARTYQPDLNENQYRRGLYTHWQRTFLHPMLTAFDAPSREECTAQRARSSTPLQALTMMNDPTFIEAARVFAARIMLEGGSTEQEKIAWAYRTAISHPPENEIITVLTEVLNSHREIYRQAPDSAKRLMDTGLAQVPADVNVVELAAWTGVARTLLNLHEMTTRY